MVEAKETRPRLKGKKLEAYLEWERLYNERNPEEEAGAKFSQSGDKAEAEVNSTKRIKTLEELVKVCKIDLAVWEIISHTINAWEVTSFRSGKPERKTNHQVKALLKKRVKSEGVLILEELEERFKKYQTPDFKREYPKTNSKAAVINLYDAHIDKLALLSETNEQSSIEANVQNFELLFDRLLTSAALHTPEVIIIPLSNDFFNTNGASNTTKRGTQQDVLVKSSVSFGIGFDLIRRVIDKAKQVARVYCPVIKGNHSEEKDFYFGFALNVAYELDPNVSIEKNQHQRKYFEYGANLLGFGHGDKEKKKIAQLPLTMAEEQKQAWARTKFRKFYLGDLHHEIEYQFLKGKDFVGCKVEFLRSVGGTDLWHYDNGYIGIPKTAYCDIWDKEEGLIHEFTASI